MKIVLTVINDLNYDQRMIKICTSLQQAGYDVLLIGRAHKSSPPLVNRPYQQRRLYVPFFKGKMMYVLYWLRLFWSLVWTKANVICAIDLDTIMSVYFASKLKGTKRVYDAHEIFTEMQEVVEKPKEKKIWDWIEKFAVPRFPVGYTIGECYAEVFKQRYGVNYSIVRNATVLRPVEIPAERKPFILYQGAVNVARCFEYLIPAMQWVDAPLIICGEGNFFEETKKLIAQYNLAEKITLKGYVAPEELRKITPTAYIGITLFEAKGLSNRLSMANRFFDYMHNGVPQLTMKYPEYEKVNEQFEIATLIDEPTPEKIAESINELLNDKEKYNRLMQNTFKAREVYCWQEEEKRLLAVYRNLASA